MNPTQNVNYQLGLLHFAHLLSNADGHVDEKEKRAILAIKQQEQIPEPVFVNFEKTIARHSEKEIYQKGIDMLNRCNDQEKISAFVHLYRLSEADNKIHIKEVRLLLYSLKASNIDFEEVESRSRLTQ